MKSKPVIVIADDDADDREILRDAFASNNDVAEYIFLENGDDLLKHLESCTPDNLPSIILLDLNMPGKDGREALKEIKTNVRFRHIPTLIFTTSSSHRDRETAYNLGANCFITKPDTFNKLISLTDDITKLWLPAL